MITRIDLNHAEIERVVRSPAGPVHREISKYGRRVVAIAKMEANVDTGRMRARINGEMVRRGNILIYRVSSPAWYTPYVHDGRGPVRAKRAKALRFRPKGSNAYIFRVSVGPYEGNPFLVNGLKKGQPWPVTTT